MQTPRALEIADLCATLALLPVIAWEVSAEPPTPRPLGAINWFLFAVLVVLAALRLRHGGWGRMSRAGRATELVLVGVAFPPIAAATGPVRLFRLLRLPLLGVRSLRALRERVVERGSLLVGLCALFAAVVGSFVILEFERAKPGSEIDTLPDALWWAAATMTTVGYGDLAPVTFPGRVVAVLLMVVGIALFGLTTALLAKWLVGGRDGGEPATKADLEMIRKELRDISASLTVRGVSSSEAWLETSPDGTTTPPPPVEQPVSTVP